MATDPQRPDTYDPDATLVEVDTELLAWLDQCEREQGNPGDAEPPTDPEPDPELDFDSWED